MYTSLGSDRDKFLRALQKALVDVPVIKLETQIKYFFLSIVFVLLKFKNQISIYSNSRFAFSINCFRIIEI
jgi:hypothetical protein